MAIPSDPLDAGKFEISDFRGGLRRDVDPTKLEDSQYPLLVNMRSRYGTLKPIKLPSKVRGFPSGLMQGCYAQGSQVLVFVGGTAHIRDYAIQGSVFQQIRDFNMNSKVDIIYAEAVPTSYYNFGRVAGEGDLSIVRKGTTFSSPSPACIVCQDGINKPKLVFSAGGVRDAKTFQQWSNPDDREYVPTGKQMLFHDGILYLVSPDGKSIYRSVSGRALDFVVAVDTNGDKLTDTLFQEEAQRCAHFVNNAEITCLAKLSVGSNNPDFGAPFLVGTRVGSFKVSPNFAQLQFGEPTFRNDSAFPTAPLNQASFAPTAGDLHFVDETGLRSYQQTLSAGGIVSKDIAVSASIYTLFENIQQTKTAVAYFDNYTVYAVNTIYGYGIVLFDNLRGVFEALDIFEELDSPIKMFCQTNIKGIKTLYFCTADGFYQYYGSSETAEWQFYTREFSSDDPLLHMKVIRFRVVMQDILEDGILSATPVCDRLKEATLSVTINKNLDAPVYPLEIPFGQSSNDTTVNHSFVPQSSKQSDKIGFLVTGNFMCELTSLHLHTESKEAKTPMEQSARAYKK